MKKILLILAVALFHSCTSDLEDPQGVPPSETLNLFGTKTALLADAKDTLHLWARIPLAAGRLDITYTTTKGVFVESDAKTIKAFADSISGGYRFARTVLRSDSSKTTVYVTAETGTVRSRIPITFN